MAFDTHAQARIDRAGFLRGAAALGLIAAVAGRSPDAAADRPARGLAHRGVSYDTGTSFGRDWPLTRERWSASLMQGEIRAIRDQLHCNSVVVIGTDIERLVATASAALEHGLHVWIQPRLFDRPQADVVKYLARAAREAERLRRQYADVSFNVGCEASLFVPGMQIAGATWQERIVTMSSPAVDWAAVRRRLNAFLGEASAAARAHFKGRVTYAAGPWEAVNWRPFDAVGIDYYAFARKRATHAAALKTLRRWKKPIVICEFGTCAHVGAPQKEGGGWEIVDYRKTPAQIVGKPVRSEQVQADYITDMLDVFEAQAIEAAYVYTFIQPDLPYSPEPRYDLDMASFGLVKAVRDDHRNPASRYRWEPKRAFDALAQRYRAAERRGA